ncbi:leucyl/phenylalanyl-tRNA--protein transferase [Zeaxanthinibacter enoshimensis]|uniref:Leucyl/phenylalanyl-tRNA--protein transferase n=1 Tax=Zeaxanthinibacter enoshimensis TaxID=392009 RepID=A0A4R6TNP2_9FLAO|nr:leucyl/phenylalanyl-tRNA--protein transferase [Zeaxanthinibacter enoshimensis]
MNNSPDSIAFLTKALVFPPIENANSEGLLAVGGDLSADRLLLAYRSGIFPWFNEDSLILWWSPDPRMVLFPGELKISKSLGRTLRKNIFKVTRNQCFPEVIKKCSAVPRPGQDGTWITAGMQQAYSELHRRGIAVSYEVWSGDELVGGLYGLQLGEVFCGESMFSTASDASKVALVQLVSDCLDNGTALIDCQVYTSHLESLGAREIPRQEYLEYLREK